MRPTRDEWAMSVALKTAARSTCLRRQVGCVLLDNKGHICGTGYNGVASGAPHCNESERVAMAWHPEDAKGISRPSKFGVIYPHACMGATLPTGQDECEAVHAEQNALLQCRDPWCIDTAYITLSPCKPCMKLLINTGCKRIVFLEEWTDPWPKQQWLKLGREWVHLPANTLAK